MPRHTPNTADTTENLDTWDSSELTELGFGSESPVPLATDNTGARALSYNPEHHEKVKHVERRHFYVRECVENHLLVVPFVSTHDNLADFLTKSLAPAQFFRLRNAIMNVPPSDRAPPVHVPSPAPRGGVETRGTCPESPSAN